MYILILFFIVSIILFVITQYLRLKKDYELENIKHNEDTFEYFNNENNLPLTSKLLKRHNVIVNFKNADSAQKLITINLPYIRNMNQPNIVARGCETKDELLTKYQNAFNDIDEIERESILKFILDLLDNIKKRNQNYYKYMCYWVNNIAIAKAQPWLEAGMPHTLDNTIIMDIDWFKSPRASTFIHEITHVHQRIIPFEYDDLFADLGYQEYKKGIETIKGMDNVLVLNRNNPDGLSYNWVWVENLQTATDTTTNAHTTKPINYWWIGAVFSSITPSSLTSVSNIALSLTYQLQDLANPARKPQSQTFFVGTPGDAPSTKPDSKTGTQDLANARFGGAGEHYDALSSNPSRKPQSQSIFMSIPGDVPMGVPSSKPESKAGFSTSRAHTTVENNKNDIANITLYYLQQQPTLLSSLKSFNMFFGNNSNNYHPNEITAKFSEWYLAYILGNMKESYDNYKGFIIYKTYFNELIKTFY